MTFKAIIQFVLTFIFNAIIVCITYKLGAMALHMDDSWQDIVLMACGCQVILLVLEACVKAYKRNKLKRSARA